MDVAQARKDISGLNRMDQAETASGGKFEAPKPHYLRSKLEMIFLILIVMIGGGFLGATAGGINRTASHARQNSEYSADWLQDWPEDNIVAVQHELSQYRMPAVTVYVQENPCTISLILVVREDRVAEAKPLFLRNSPHVKNWLTKYFSMLTVEQIRGASNCKYLRKDICDNLNMLIWPGKKGLIERVDFAHAPRFD